MIAVVAIAVVIFIAWSWWTRPAVVPVQMSPTVTSVPGEVYIAQTARSYMTAIVEGEPRAIQRLRLENIDSGAVRAETLGRFASVPTAALKVGAVHDELSVSGNGNSQPPTLWSAVVTMEVTQASRVQTFGVELTGLYSANGSVDSSKAEASAQ